MSGYDDGFVECNECGEYDPSREMEQTDDGGIRHRDVRSCLAHLRRKVRDLAEKHAALAERVDSLSDKVWDVDHSYD